MAERMDGRMDEWMGEWMNGLMDKMDSRARAYMCVCMFQIK